jgi:hypothetical protein
MHNARSLTPRPRGMVLDMAARKKTTMTQDAVKDATMTFRMPAAERERLGRIAVLMGERAGGLPLPESYALRAALKRGLDELEAELTGKGKR